MLDYLEFTDGIKIVSRIADINKDMLMDITVYQIAKGTVLEFNEQDKETAILLMEGAVEFRWLANSEMTERADVFTQPPYCLHVCRNTFVHVVATIDSEILVQSTLNEKTFDYHYYKPEDCKIERMGETQWEGTALRDVLTIFDYKNAPYSNMVMGEVITKAGRWSSYIPHSHEQPEVYYYKFDKPQGFGAAFIGENAYKVADGSAASIPGGLTHPQASAPGYNMYYCWMIRHLTDNPWTTRDNDPIHTWLLDN